jgi:Adenylate and Guanylate cyclase catalytic domain
MLGLSPAATDVLLIGLAVWLTVAITVAVLMGRREHSPFEWFLIGAVLGPIALPIAWGRIRDEPTAPDREVVDEGAPAAGLPPTRIGIHSGPVVFQDGDVYGRTVNVASRIADLAQAGDVLTTEETMQQAKGVEVGWVRIGRPSWTVWGSP